MFALLCIALLSANVGAIVFQGTPGRLPVINDKIRYWAPTNAKWMPDGKMVAFRENASDPQTKFIFNIELDFRMVSPDNRLNNVTAPAPGNRSEYPSPLPPVTDRNYVTLPNDIPIPPASVTGARDDGTHYDYNDGWLMNAFRLSETSQPDAPSTSMIGFAHNEDYWGEGGAYKGCTYKSIGVRYSKDLGKSWTRSVPIITKLVQLPSDQKDQCDVKPRAGTGDFAAMWNHLNKTWVIIAHEDEYSRDQNTSPALVMSISSDPLARPYKWTRLDPITKKTSPGFIGDKNSLFHPDLLAARGSNPSIIRDDKNKVWHMTYTKWGGTLVYTNTSDFVRWTEPTALPSGGYYNSLIGNRGDTLTTDGKATLYYTGEGNPGLWGKSVWAVDVDFSPLGGKENQKHEEQTHSHNYVDVPKQNDQDVLAAKQEDKNRYDL